MHERRGRARAHAHISAHETHPSYGACPRAPTHSVAPRTHKCPCAARRGSSARRGSCPPARPKTAPDSGIARACTCPMRLCTPSHATARARMPRARARERVSAEFVDCAGCGHPLLCRGPAIAGRARSHTVHQTYIHSCCSPPSVRLGKIRTKHPACALGSAHGSGGAPAAGGGCGGRAVRSVPRPGGSAIRCPRIFHGLRDDAGPLGRGGGPDSWRRVTIPQTSPWERATAR